MAAIILFCIGLAALLTLEEAGLFLIPGDISLVAAGLHASPHPTHLLYTWIAASGGMILGSSILFHGVNRTDRFDRILPARVRRLIRLHGVYGVAIARLVPGLRNATVFAAASANMRYPKFLWGLIPAAMLWSGFLLLLGWFGGSAMLAGFGMVHDSTPLKVVSLSILAGVLSFVFYRLRAAPRPRPKVKAAVGD